MNDISCTIRPANKKDLDQLFAMHLELVKHEGSLSRFKLTRQRLEDEIFGVNADWHALVAVANHQELIGFCMYTYANINRAFNLSPMIQIDELYVKPDYRRANIGQQLMQKLAVIAKDKNIGRFNVWCVKDNVVGQNFYNKIGAEKRDFIDVYSIAVESLLV